MTKNNAFRKTLSSFRVLKLSIILALVATIQWQCISPPDFVGGDLIPPQDIFNVKIDTSFSISVFTVPYDTVVTQGFSEAIIGETYDPIFGRTKASFVTQLRIPSLNQRYGTNPTIDSAFLFITFSERLGNEPINIAVYELTDSLARDSIYNSLAPIDNMYNPAPIGQFLLPFNGEEGTLKIPIDLNWVNSRLIQPTLQDTTIMSSQVNFLKHFYGIHVAPTSTFADYAKGMYYFNYLSGLSRLLVYYKNDEQEVDTVSLTYSYVMADPNYRFNHFKHDFEAADPNLTINFNSPESTQDSVFYVKGLGGAKGVIVLDDIYNWIQKMPIAINRAELRIELEENESMPADTLLNNLFLFKSGKLNRVNLNDYLIMGESFGGKYSKSKKYYSFNITYHLQSLLKDPNADNKIYVESRTADRRAEGAVLRSGSHSSRMKLIITYTKL